MGSQNKSDSYTSQSFRQELWLGYTQAVDQECGPFCLSTWIVCGSIRHHGESGLADSLHEFACLRESPLAAADAKAKLLC